MSDNTKKPLRRATCALPAYQHVYAVAHELLLIWALGSLPWLV